jgi:hypothetical protein
MNIKKVVNVAKVVFVAVYVVPPVIDGAICVIKTTAKVIKNGLDKTGGIKELKKDFELKRQGVITVDYQEVDE